MINFDKAKQIIENMNFENKTSKVPLLNALNKVLVNDIYSPINVPHFNKSAMDGYCLKKEDINSYDSFEIVDTIYAGQSNNITLKDGQCIKIMTGACICPNSNIVIQKELAHEFNNKVSFNLPTTTKINSNICLIGEDIKKDMLLFKKNTLLLPINLSILKSTGLEEVEVYDELNIGIVTTGDEVISKYKNVENKLKSNHIFNSNETYIYTRLLQLGITKVNAYTIKDDIKSLKHFLENNNHDLIITTGGISVGDKDVIRNFIKESKPLIHFDRVNIMPGGPVAFWEYNNTPILSLAGSPFANFVTFELFGSLLIANMTNNERLKPKFCKRIFKSTWSKPVKKQRFVRVYADNLYCKLTTTNHLASTIYQMSNCNAFLNINPHTKKIQENEEVEIILLGGNYYE